MIKGPTDRRLLESAVSDSGELEFISVEALPFEIEGRKYEIPCRYLSDGYSMPRLLKPFFRKLFLRKPLLLFPAIFHDWSNDIDAEYEGDRWQSDADFKRLMKHYKMPFVWRELFYAGVVAGSWKVWKTQKMRIVPIRIT